jgi:hypothetical protein
MTIDEELLIELEELSKRLDFIKDFPDEFLSEFPDEFLADYKASVETKTGTKASHALKVSRSLPKAMIFAAIQTAALALTAMELAYEVQKDEEVRKRRPRRRTNICTKICLGLIADSEIDLQSGYSSYRALETKPEKRKNRKFISRA